MTPLLIIGTAQWGTEYGIANRTGIPSDAEVAAILQLARRSGVRDLDTARAYGDSEARIGRLAPATDGWRVITKTDPNAVVAEDGEATRAAVERSITSSRRALRRDSLDVVLLHRSLHRTMLGGVALQALVEARTAGVIAAIGVSASNPVDAPAALDDPDVDIVQVATSILDQRLVRNGFFDTAAAKGKRVHVRSVFLQGAALLEPDDLPEYLSELRRPIAGLRAEARVLGTSVEAICLAYVRNLPIEGIIVGCETVQQAAGNFRAWTQDISPEDLTRIVKSIPDLPEEALTPARWGA